MQPFSLRKTLLIAVALGVLIIVMVISALNKAAGQDQDNDPVEGQENIQPAPAASLEPNPVQGLPEEDRDQIPQIIRQFGTAYASHSWLDSEAGVWLEKTKPFTTAAYQNALEAEFAGNEDSPSWAAFKKAQTKTAPEAITTVIISASGARLAESRTRCPAGRQSGPQYSRPSRRRNELASSSTANPPTSPTGSCAAASATGKTSSSKEPFPGPAFATAT